MPSTRRTKPQAPLSKYFQGSVHLPALILPFLKSQKGTAEMIPAEAATGTGCMGNSGQSLGFAFRDLQCGGTLKLQA